MLNSTKSAILPVVLCLCAALVLLFWPVFFQGKVLVPGDIPNTDPFLSRGVEKAPLPQNTLLSDQIEQFYVYHSVAKAGLERDGQLPLWNPYLFTGQPLVANSQSSLFYPPNLLLHLMSPGKVATLRVFFNLLFAGIFTYLFCRKLEISEEGSLLSALSFAFSGPLIVWVGYPLANVVACLPFLMWAGEELLERSDLRRCALLGAGMGLSLLAGHPETSFQVLAVFSLYFLARLALLDLAPRAKGGILARYLLAVVLGGVVSAIQILPFLDFMRESSTFARGGRGSHGTGGGNFFYSPEWLAHLATAFTLVCPNFFGNPLDRNYIWPSSVFQNYNEQAVYFGLIPLALAVGALFAKGRRRPLLIIAVLALFCITVAWHLPGFEAVNHLPIFSMAPNKRLRLPFVFLGAVLAGYGLDALLQQLRSRQKERGSLLGSGFVLLLAPLLFVWILGLRFTIGPGVPPESFRYYLLYNIFSFGQWRTFLPLLIAVAAGAAYLLARRNPGTARLFPGLLIGLTLVELVALGWGYNPAVPEREILPTAPAVEFLKQREKEPFRILTTDGFFYPNFGAVYGISDVAGYDVPVYQRYSDLYLGQGGASFGGQIDSRQQWDPEWPLVDFLNVKYVVTPRELKDPKYLKVYSVRNLNVYQNSRALPRAFMVYDAEVVPERKSALERVLKGGVDLGRKAVLEQAPPAGLPGAGAGGSAQVQVASYGNDEVVLRVNTDKPGLLVTSDLYTPDWKAALDGRETELLRANYTYRAVPVPAGSHEVRYRYQPASYRVGMALTGVGVLALLALVVLGRRKEGAQAGGSNPGT